MLCPSRVCGRTDVDAKIVASASRPSALSHHSVYALLAAAETRQRSGKCEHGRIDLGLALGFGFTFRREAMVLSRSLQRYRRNLQLDLAQGARQKVLFQDLGQCRLAFVTHGFPV